MDQDKCVTRINTAYPCRKLQISELFSFIGRAGEPFPSAIYVFGQSGTGKSVILSSLLRYIDVRSAIVNCVECHSPRVLYEAIIDDLNDFRLSASGAYTSSAKCDSMGEFLVQLRKLSASSIVIVLDNAENLRDMNVNLLPALLKLQELSGLNLCTILVSQLPYEKFYPKAGIPEVLRCKFPQYTVAEVAQILQKDFNKVQNYVTRQLEKQIKDQAVLHHHMDVLNECVDQEFYDNYLHAFLCIFFRACRNVTQLRMVAKECFPKYCEPLYEDSALKGNVTQLWHHISDTLKRALATIYSRIESTDGVVVDASSKHVLELPYYAKYLLLAGFLSSHNPASQDRRLFVKNHGKQRKRMQAVTAKAKLGEQTSLQQGPKGFTIDRLLAIFHAILDQKVTLTCNLLAQISTLVQLNFFVYVNGDSSAAVEGSARLQCFLTYEFATQIGEMVGFNVRQYLYDLI